MKRVCAWCHKELGTKPGPDHLITHGICDKCLCVVSTDPEKARRTCLDHIPAPILLVNADGVVLTANDFACKRLNKKLPEVKQVLGGDVMACAWAQLPGGCGRTEHCQACIIRESVLQTNKTGRSINRRRAFQVVDTPEGRKKRWLLITTQKVNNVVLLRIDEMGEADESEALDCPAPKPARRRPGRSEAEVEARRQRHLAIHDPHHHGKH